MKIEDIYEIYLQHPRVQTDTRKLEENDLFFALKGPNFNGNEFAIQALEKGAAYAIVDEEIPARGNQAIRVENTLHTLQELAGYHRISLGKKSAGGNQIPFIAITGSNGKTTTKELIHAVLSSTFKTYTTEGNLNNHIGIPLTLLKVRPDAEMAVIEMGANHLHEIESYCRYAMPTHGLITNIGKAHLEGFGGEANVKKGKGELFDFIRNHNRTAFVNSDDPAVVDLAKGIKKTIFYGKSGKDLRGSLIKGDPFTEVNIEGNNSFQIRTKLAGRYNLSNILAAVCIGRYFKVGDSRIKDAIESYQPSNSRSQLIHRGNNVYILDAYNANPSSMKLAIENFASMKGPKKILILGDMMELGSESQSEHQDIVDLIKNFKWHSVVLVGEYFKRSKGNFICFDNSNEAGDWLRKQHLENTQILIKGSRSLQMEKVLE